METGAPPGVPVPPSAEMSRKSTLTWVLAISGGFFFVVMAFVLLSYLAFRDAPVSVFGKKHVGVLEIEGMILDSRQTIEHLRVLVERDDIAAIVVRINSPGGGIAPSQEIYTELMKARDEKKIVVSMGSLAASGGYYVAAPAHTIVANAGTVTGSIGVLMKFMNVADLQRWAKLKSVTFKSGPFKDMGAPDRDVRPEEERVFRAMIEEMRGQFVEDIARARGMTFDAVSALADGRIYTGKEAKRIGLVDEIGDLQDAADVAAQLAGIRGKPELVYPPERKPRLIDYLLDSAVERFRESLASESTATRFPQFLAVWEGFSAWTDGP